MAKADKMRVTGVQCPLCKEKIWSRSVHDFRYCKCGGVFVDGGREYLRYGGTAIAAAKPGEKVVVFMNVIQPKRPVTLVDINKKLPQLAKRPVPSPMREKAGYLNVANYLVKQFKYSEYGAMRACLKHHAIIVNGMESDFFTDDVAREVFTVDSSEDED